MLDPAQIGGNIQGPDFDKMQGRNKGGFLDVIQEDDAEELILEPDRDYLKKPIKGFVDFEKQRGREETKHLDDDEMYDIGMLLQTDSPKNLLPH